MLIEVKVKREGEKKGKSAKGERQRSDLIDFEEKQQKKRAAK
jgi:hypothetical protein